MSVKETIRKISSGMLVKSGFTNLYRHLASKPGSLILYGHRVTGDDEGYLQGISPDDFEDQIAYLKANYRVLRLSELVNLIRNSKEVPDNSVVLTFDDGFKDNFTCAMPILLKYDMPATIFVTTGCITSGQLPWSQQLGYIFQNTRDQVFLSSFGGQVTLPIQTKMQRRHAYSYVKRFIADMVHMERQDEIQKLSQQLSVILPEDRMMDWDDINVMVKNGFEIGAHTFSHSLLARIPSDHAREEMLQSLADIKSRIDNPNVPFCFPGGSYSESLIREVQSLKFSSVFVPNRRKRYNNHNNSTPFNLSRTGLPNASALYLEAELDGPFHSIRNLYRK